MGSRLAFSVSHAFICGLVVSLYISRKILSSIIICYKIVINIFIESKKMFCV